MIAVDVTASMTVQASQQGANRRGAATLFAAGYRAREAASSFGHPRGNLVRIALL